MKSKYPIGAVGIILDGHEVKKELVGVKCEITQSFPLVVKLLENRGFYRKGKTIAFSFSRKTAMEDRKGFQIISL